jgi:hypothetical protein
VVSPAGTTPDFSVSDKTLSFLNTDHRLDADPAHRWLRGCVRDVCAARRR